MTRPSGARWSSLSAASAASQARSVTSNTAPRRLEAVSSGPMMRKLSGLRRITSRRKPPSTRVASLVLGARPVDLDGVVAKVGHLQLAQQQAAVGVGVGAHPPLALGRERGQLRAQGAALVEQLLGPVGAQPAPRAAPGARALCARSASGTWWERNDPSAGSPSTSLGPVQPLGVRSTIIGQRGRAASAACAPVDSRARRRLDPRAALDLGSRDDLIERGGHQLVHRRRVRALHEARRVAVALEQRAQLLLGNPREHGRVGDLVAVQMQHRQHGAVARRVEELVRVPARRQRTRLRLAVADHAAGQQVGIVEHGAVGVHERVAELAALVDRARRLGGDVAGDAAGERELPEQPAAAPPRRGRCGGRPRCRCPPDRCSPPAPDRRVRVRSRRSRSGRARGSRGSCARRRSSARASCPSGRAAAA